MLYLEKHTIFKAIGWIIAVGVVSACGIFGGRVPFHEQWPIYKGLRTTAGIIFGVLGAWIAIIYPQALNSIFGSAEGSSPSQRISQLRQLLTPMWYSTLVLIFVLVVGLVEPILKQSEFLLRHRSVLRATSLALLGGATILQLWSVLLVVSPAEEFDVELRQKKKKKERLDALRGNRLGGETAQQRGPETSRK